MTDDLWRFRILMVGLIVAAAISVWIAAQASETAQERGNDQVNASAALLAARLDLDAASQGFLLTGDSVYVEPYISARLDLRAAQAQADETTDRAAEQSLLATQNQLSTLWLRSASRAIKRRRNGRSLVVAAVRNRRILMERFSRANAEFTAVATARRSERQSDAGKILIGVIIAFGLLAAIFDYAFVERPARSRRASAASHSEFADLLQYASSEVEAQELLSSRLERIAPGADAAVLVRNTRDNRLTGSAGVNEDSKLAEILPRSVPSSCVAIRRGRANERPGSNDPLVDCRICGAISANSACIPLLVGGEVIGATLLTSESSLPPVEDTEIRATIDLAAPVLGNLRNLAVAETRAVTDALTGLANARAAADTLDRMAAYAGRTGSPLAAIMGDLDHFKRINDSYGHQIGDEVLAAVGRLLSDEIRASDFVARYGGEEFLILLQGSGRDDSTILAEKIRLAVKDLKISGLTTALTISLGVAAIPENASDAESLLGAADRALYAAKKAGRDRVRVAGELDVDNGDPESPKNGSDDVAGKSLGDSGEAPR